MLIAWLPATAPGAVLAAHAGRHGSLGAALAGLVLLAALLHATWNAVAHLIPDRWRSFALVNTGAAVAAVPLVLVAAPPARAAWVPLGVSVAVHLVYNLLLMRTYNLGDFSSTYPIARGVSPLLVTLFAAAFVHEAPTAVQVLAIAVISAGLVLLSFSGRRRLGADLSAPTGSTQRRTRRPALRAALLTGLSIATYTTVDGYGVRRSGSAGGYTGWLILLEAAPWVFVLVVRTRRRRQSGIGDPRTAALGLGAGVLSLVAYGLVLLAQTRAELGPVAALRETSIIFGALIGAVFLHERLGRSRILPAVVVVLGIALLELGTAR